MKNHIKFVIMLTAAIWLSLALGYSQQSTVAERTPEERAQRQTEVLTKELSLTPEQQVKVKAINLKYAQENEQAHKTAIEARKKLKNKDEELKAILTEEQKPKYEAFKAERKARFIEKRQAKRAI